MSINDLARRSVPPSLLRLYRLLRYGRHEVLRIETGGLLPGTVYRELTRLVRQAPPGLDLIEVGGAAGTASIAMAWGLRPAGGRSPRVIVVEKCEGGTRTPYGGWEENKTRFERFVKSHRVDRQVVLYPHYLTRHNGAEVRALLRTEKIAGLMCDADGMVHRDILLFGDLIAPGGFLVIDDYHKSHSPKHEITFAVVNHLIEAGVFLPTRLVDDTFFGGLGNTLGEPLYQECEAIAQGVCKRLGVVFDIRGMSSVSTDGDIAESA